MVSGDGVRQRGRRRRSHGRLGRPSNETLYGRHKALSRHVDGASLFQSRAAVQRYSRTPPASPTHPPSFRGRSRGGRQRIHHERFHHERFHQENGSMSYTAPAPIVQAKTGSGAEGAGLKVALKWIVEEKQIGTQDFRKLATGSLSLLIKSATAELPHPNPPTSPDAEPKLLAVRVSPADGRTGDVFKADVEVVGRPEPLLTYQWLLDGVKIDGATAPTYISAAPGDLFVRVVATNTSGCDSRTSDLVLVAEASGGGNPRVAAAGNIAGGGVIGAPHTVSDIVVLGEEARLSFQWTLDGKPVPNATAETFVPATGDDGMQLACVVAASNGFGESSGTTDAVEIRFAQPEGPAEPVAWREQASSGVRWFDLTNLFSVRHVSEPTLLYALKPVGDAFAEDAFVPDVFGASHEFRFVSLDLERGMLIVDTDASGAVEADLKIVASNSGGSSSALVRLAVTREAIPEPDGYILNGDFGSTEGWKIGAGWIIGDGVARCAAPPQALATLSQVIADAEDVTAFFDVSFDVEVSAGYLHPFFGTPLDPAAALGDRIGASGRYTRQAAFPNGHQKQISFISDWFDGFAGSIDNVQIFKL
jgi:hypothetical protein